LTFLWSWICITQFPTGQWNGEFWSRRWFPGIFFKLRILNTQVCLYWEINTRFFYDRRRKAFWIGTFERGFCL